jgi:RNA polymerase sigma factor (sigma-70 family)
MATWLRAVLSQRYVDRIRVTRRVEPLPEELPAITPFESEDAECPKYVEFLRTALEQALARLESRDRLRMGLYYAQQLTLAETGRILKEHEATVSRQLARTRARIREEVEKKLLAAGLGADEVARCFECAARDPRTMNLEEMLGSRKEFAQDRSI